MKYEFQSICDQGAVRPNNEDAIKFGLANKDQIAWMIIADGMGGHLAGEIASQLLVDEIENAVKDIGDPNSIDWLCWIEIELNRANNNIYFQSKNNISQQGMGSTAVLAIVYKHQCYLGWVGDSRCYHFRGDMMLPSQLVQLTVDHTLVQALLDKGAITEKEAKISNNKNILSKAMGIKKGVDVETKQVTVRSKDILVLSTDGLHDSLSLEFFESNIKQIYDGVIVGDQLVKSAIKNGSKDNITFGSILIN